MAQKQFGKQPNRVLPRFSTRDPLVSMRRWNENGRKEVERDLVWWPTRTAFDRQLAEVGVAFQKKGPVGSVCAKEWIILLRSDNGYLRSRAATFAEIQRAKSEANEF